MSKQTSILIKLDFKDDGSGIGDFCFEPDYHTEGVPIFVVRVMDDDALLDALANLLLLSGHPLRIPDSYKPNQS
jgi:hypothetical protein